MKPNFWVSSPQANELLKKQLVTWPLAKENYRKLASIQTKVFDLGGFSILVQLTPSRLLSSNARVDPQSILNRKCFLCSQNLHQEQVWLPFGLRYYVLCNPYPIFPEHFTITDRRHEPQEIGTRFDDFLELIKRLDNHTLFYNGPKSGASAPDHAHFQAVTRGIMPLDNEVMLPDWLGEEVIELPHGSLRTLTGYLRNGFVIRAKSRETAISLFKAVYNALETTPEENEPKMNIFGFYTENEWIITIIPRQAHRPRQFFAEGEGQLLCSPGAADMGGLFITARPEDFEKINAPLLEDVYRQLCYENGKINDIANHIHINYSNRQK